MTAALILLLGALLPGLAAEEPGRTLFAAAGCLSCHRVGHKGGNTGPDLTLVGFRRSKEWLDLWLTSPRAWKHDTLMPEPRLSKSAQAALVAYLEAQKGQAWTRRPWDAAPEAEKGRAIFHKAGCTTCHGPRGRGGHPNNNVEGGLIPALPALVATYTPEELKHKIEQGSRPMRKDPAGPEPLARMPAWAGVLTDAEISAVTAYVLTLAEKTAGADW